MYVTRSHTTYRTDTSLQYLYPVRLRKNKSFLHTWPHLNSLPCNIFVFYWKPTWLRRSHVQASTAATKKWAWSFGCMYFSAQAIEIKNYGKECFWDEIQSIVTKFTGGRRIRLSMFSARDHLKCVRTLLFALLFHFCRAECRLQASFWSAFCKQNLSDL